MITANDAYNLGILNNKKNTCEGIDEWIKNDLVNRLDSDMRVLIGEDKISSQGWKKDMFIDSMRERGFFVKYFCDDRPCGGCYFTISIPPQERY